MQENGIINQVNNLPSTMDDLSKFVLIGREKLNAVRAEIRAIDKVELAQEVREQKLSEAQDIADAVLDAEVRIGQLMNAVPKASGGDRRSENFKNDTGVGFETPTQDDSVKFSTTDDEKAFKPVTSEPQYTPDDTGDNFWDEVFKTEEPPVTEAPKQPTKKEIIEAAGLTERQVQRFQTLAEYPELVAKAKAEARENDDIVTRSAVLNMIKAEEKKKQILEAEQSIQKQATSDYKPILFVGDGIAFTPTEKYDLLLTDPPYSTDVDNIEEFVEDWLYKALDNVKPTGFAYVFIGGYPNEVKAYLNAKLPEHIALCQQLIWTYKNTLGNNPKDRYKQNYQVCLFYRGIDAPNLDCPLTNEQWAVQEINAPDGRQGDRYHAWQKPMEIAERFIRHSTKPGMTVFDPFACTGTFLLASAKLGRKAYGFEINPDNANIAFKRGCVRHE